MYVNIHNTPILFYFMIIPIPGAKINPRILGKHDYRSTVHIGQLNKKRDEVCGHIGYS